MGEHKLSRQPEGTATWEQRKAEQAERTEAAMADPVSRFYRRHGHPARRSVQVTTPGPGGAEDKEPGTA
jgi:hypothetical protein